MARAWELRLDGRWWTRALLGFGLSGLVLNSLMSWFVCAAFSTGPYVTIPGWRRLLAWSVDSTRSGPWSRTLTLLAHDPPATLWASFTLAAAIGIAYATLRQRFDPEPEVGATGFRAHQIALLVVGFVLPFLPLVALGWFLFRVLSALPR